jgi:hypothetical protein
MRTQLPAVADLSPAPGLTPALLERATVAAAKVLGVEPARLTVRLRGTPGRPPTTSDEAIREAVAREGSVRGAAKALGLAESGLRRRLKSGG